MTVLWPLERFSVNTIQNPIWVYRLYKKSCTSLGNRTAETEMTHNCWICNTPTERRCSACSSIFYCNERCQRSDWKSHRTFCRATNDPSRKCVDGVLVNPYLRDAYPVKVVLVKFKNDPDWDGEDEWLANSYDYDKKAMQSLLRSPDVTLRARQFVDTLTFFHDDGFLMKPYDHGFRLDWNELDRQKDAHFWGCCVLVKAALWNCVNQFESIQPGICQKLLEDIVWIERD